MTIVKHVDKKSGRTYVYESTPHYDPVSKQQRPKRKYLGYLDPQTGELIPSAGKRGRRPGVKNVVKSVPSPVPEAELNDRIAALSAQLKEKEKRLSVILRENELLKTKLKAVNERLRAAMLELSF